MRNYQQSRRHFLSTAALTFATTQLGSFEEAVTEPRVENPEIRLAAKP